MTQNKYLKSREKLFLPTVIQTSLFYNFKKEARYFIKIIRRIRDKIKESLISNDERMRMLVLKWNEQVKKLSYSYC